ncbi:MAG: RsiV family protein [Treponema sp.]|jgi:hypothetical protein|nr:RsiV family protein [Treponema sp.]
MKRIYPIMVLALLFFSCAKTTMENPLYQGLFEEVSVKETIPFKSGSIEFSLTLIDVRSKGPLQKLVRQLLYGNIPPGDYARNSIAKAKSGYEEFLASNGDTESASSHWSYEETHRVDITAHYAVLSETAYSFTGGAHGNYYSLARVIDLDTVEHLGPASLFDKPGLDALVARELRRVSRERTGEELSPDAPLSSGIYFEDRIPASGNFFPDNAGINFQWSPYQIAPYVWGQIAILIPWTDAAKLLSPKGRALMEAYTTAN